MLGKALFKIGYMLRRPKVLSHYRSFKQDELTSIETLKKKQDADLQNLISFCIENVPYYSELFDQLGLKKGDIKTIGDINKLPILTKKTIKTFPEKFIPKNYKIDYVCGSTGGSTGEPLKYRMSLDCYCRGIALLYRGWGLAGYSPGDKVSIIAGASLTSTQQPFRAKVQDSILNQRHYSSYGMGSKDLDQYVKHIKKWKPSYLRGYASSLYLLAKYIKDEGCEVNQSLRGVFSTSEVLLETQRQVIQEVFGVKVHNNYGLNDGGISAFECGENNGMHIDTERSLLEVVDDRGCSVVNQTGKILATSLHNYAMPLIRYDTGDLGEIDFDKCSCGNERPLLKNVSGRVTDFLKLNGRIVGSPVLTVLMGKVDIEQYQIHQVSSNRIIIKYINEHPLPENDRSFITKSIESHVGELYIDFQKVSLFEMQAKNKFKFIINEHEC